MRDRQDSAQSSREVLAITGKGGVGKTTFTAILAKILAADGVNLLAVDADPPVSLTYALGAQPTKRTRPKPTNQLVGMALRERAMEGRSGPMAAQYDAAPAATPDPHRGRRCGV